MHHDPRPLEPAPVGNSDAMYRWVRQQRDAALRAWVLGLFRQQRRSVLDHHPDLLKN